MINGRLSLEAFKAKAENVNTNEVLEKVQGGDWSDCHGCDGTWAKIKDYASQAFEAMDSPASGVFPK